MTSKIIIGSLFVTTIMLALQTTTTSAQYIFGLSSGQSTWCTDCCQDNGCTYSGSYSLSRSKPTALSLAAQVSCSGGPCDCYSNGGSSTFADITAISKKGKRPVIVNCSGNEASLITLNFLKPLKDKNGTYWPYPFDGNCSNNTNAIKEAGGQDSIVPACPSGGTVPVKGPNASPNCVWSDVGCNAVISAYPAEDALILAVSATFPDDAYYCTYGGEGEGSVSCTIHQG